MLAIFTTSSVETTIPPPLDPVTPRDLTTNIHQMTPITTTTPPNPTISTQSPPAPTSHLPTPPPYEAPLTPSLVASQVEAPPLLPEKDTSALYNASTTSPIPTTHAVCLLLYSQKMTSTASTTNKMTPWSSLLKSRIIPLRKSLLIRAALLISSTEPLTKNSNFRTPPWSHMTSQYMAFPANRYPPKAT